MTAVRRAAAIATDLTCRAVGRRTVVRTARYVLSRARLDYPNDMSTNGESALQRWILRFSQAGEQIHVADVGANVGRWSHQCWPPRRRQAARRISGWLAGFPT